jgi:hypothetical protein
MFTKINYPDPHNRGMRLVGWRIPEKTAGLSDAIFWLEGIERASQPEINTGTLWFIMDGKETTLPETVYVGSVGKTQAQTEADNMNSNGASYSVVAFHEAVFMVKTNFHDHYHDKDIVKK